MDNLNIDVNIKKKLKEFDLDVSFKMEKGVFGILGASGCGKSMTLKSIAGIVDPDSGHIVLHDQIDDVLYDSSKKINQKPQQRRVGYLFQNYALFPNMTVEQNIAVGLKNKNKAKVDEMVKRFQLENLEKRYPYQLSGGQQQRVALARILAYEPKVILLDEPFSAMDSFLKENLRLELAKVLKSFDGIAIMVTHDRDEAFQLCDRLLLLDKGKVIREGKTKDVFEDPQSVIAARLTGCKNISRIKRIDESHVMAKDFGNITLKVDHLSDDINYIGIRAHDLVATNIENGENIIASGKYEVSEMPFEWYVTLENGIWWKKSKDIHDSDYLKVVPDYFYLDPSKILLLRG